MDLTGTYGRALRSTSTGWKSTQVLMAVAVAFSGILVAFPSAQAHSTQPPNLLVVDLADASLTYENRGSLWTTVEINGVPPSEAAFALLDPVGHATGFAPASSSGGTVTFEMQVLVDGLYSLVGPAGGGIYDVLGMFEPHAAGLTPCVIDLGLFSSGSVSASQLKPCDVRPPPVVVPEACEGGGYGCLDDLQACPGGGTGCLTSALPCGTAGKPDCAEYVCGDDRCRHDVCGGEGTACVTGLLPCGTAGKPSCDDYVCDRPSRDRCDADPALPCDEPGKPHCVNYACGLVPGLGTDCDADLPCNDTGKPSCIDVLCSLVEEGCALPCGQSGAPSCPDFVCQRVPGPGCGGGLPCDGPNEPSCVDLACSLVLDSDCGVDLPCNDTGKPSCVDLVCSQVPCDNPCVSDPIDCIPVCSPIATLCGALDCDTDVCQSACVPGRACGPNVEFEECEYDPAMMRPVHKAMHETAGTGPLHLAEEEGCEPDARSVPPTGIAGAILEDELASLPTVRPPSGPEVPDVSTRSLFEQFELVFYKNAQGCGSGSHRIDTDGDGIRDEDDDDIDCDGLLNAIEVYSPKADSVPSDPYLRDTDGDGIIDVVDAMPSVGGLMEIQIRITGIRAYVKADYWSGTDPFLKDIKVGLFQGRQDSQVVIPAPNGLRRQGEDHPHGLGGGRDTTIQNPSLISAKLTQDLTHVSQATGNPSIHFQFAVVDHDEWEDDTLATVDMGALPLSLIAKTLVDDWDRGNDDFRFTFSALALNADPCAILAAGIFLRTGVPVDANQLRDCR